MLGFNGNFNILPKLMGFGPFEVYDSTGNSLGDGVEYSLFRTYEKTIDSPGNTSFEFYIDVHDLSTKFILINNCMKLDLYSILVNQGATMNGTDCLKISSNKIPYVANSKADIFAKYDTLDQVLADSNSADKVFHLRISVTGQPVGLNDDIHLEDYKLKLYAICANSIDGPYNGSCSPLDCLYSKWNTDVFLGAIIINSDGTKYKLIPNSLCGLAYKRDFQVKSLVDATWNETNSSGNVVRTWKFVSFNATRPYNCITGSNLIEGFYIGSLGSIINLDGYIKTSSSSNLDMGGNVVAILYYNPLNDDWEKTPIQIHCKYSDTNIKIGSFSENNALSSLGVYAIAIENNIAQDIQDYYISFVLN